MKGIVRKLLPDKSYGFISNTEKDYFFHREDYSGHWDDLVIDYHKDMKIEVEFEEKQSAKGPRAFNVKRLDWPNQSVAELAE